MDTPSVLKVLSENVGRVKELLVRAVPVLAGQDWTHTVQANKLAAQSSVMGKEVYIATVSAKCSMSISLQYK